MGGVDSLISWIWEVTPHGSHSLRITLPSPLKLALTCAQLHQEGTGRQPVWADSGLWALSWKGPTCPCADGNREQGGDSLEPLASLLPERGFVGARGSHCSDPSFQ